MTHDVLKSDTMVAAVPWRNNGNLFFWHKKPSLDHQAQRRGDQIVFSLKVVPRLQLLCPSLAAL
jgi:hypothetical protein